MATEIKKLKDLEYDELATLSVIEKDEDLSAILIDEVNMSFNVLRTLSKEDKLNDKTKRLIQDLFEKVILTKTNLINRYVLIAEAGGKKITSLQEPVIEEPAAPKLKPKKVKELPRRYGRANILKDIEKQGGKATTAQITALELNTLKNIYVNLNTRLINDMLTKQPKLSDEDYREIRSAITILKNKTKGFFKKK